jgi:hypothetical protein
MQYVISTRIEVLDADVAIRAAQEYTELEYSFEPGQSGWPTTVLDAVRLAWTLATTAGEEIEGVQVHLSDYNDRLFEEYNVQPSQGGVSGDQQTPES